MRVGAAQRVDLADIRRIAGEFEDEPIRRSRVDRFAVAEIGLAEPAFVFSIVSIAAPPPCPIDAAAPRGKHIVAGPLPQRAALENSSMQLPLDGRLRIGIQTIHRRTEPAQAPWLPTIDEMQG